jgi:peroxiredoxin
MKLHEGSIAPEFTAADIEGKEVSLSDLRQDGSVVLVFLRGFS